MVIVLREIDVCEFFRVVFANNAWCKICAEWISADESGVDVFFLTKHESLLGWRSKVGRQPASLADSVQLVLLDSDRLSN